MISGRALPSIAAALAAGLCVGVTEAAARPDTRTLTCAQANALVEQSGAVVMTTGDYTFERFVSGRRYCDPWQWIKPRYVPTRDEPRCVLHSVCWDPPVDFGTSD